MSLAPILPYDLPRPSSWPQARAKWSLDASRAALLVHDVQEYFLAPFPAEAPPLRIALANLVQLVATCRACAIPVFFSMQPGEQERSERGLLWDLWGAGIAARPEGQRLAAGLRATTPDELLVKRRYSAFHATDLETRLGELGRTQLLIGGVYGHIGCLSTASDAFARGIQPFLLADAMADFSAEDHLVAIRQVARTCGVVVSSKDAEEALWEGKVRQALHGLLPADVSLLEPTQELDLVGLDSLRFMTLLERLLPAGHAFSFEELVDARTIRTLAQLLRRSAPAGDDAIPASVAS